jgi:hypothetical protein
MAAIVWSALASSRLLTNTNVLRFGTAAFPSAINALLAEPVQLGALVDSDGVGRLQAEHEIVRCLIDPALQVLLARESVVVGGIDADSLEDLCIFC